MSEGRRGRRRRSVPGKQSMFLPLASLAAAAQIFGCGDDGVLPAVADGRQNPVGIPTSMLTAVRPHHHMKRHATPNHTTHSLCVTPSLQKTRGTSGFVDGCEKSRHAKRPRFTEAIFGSRMCPVLSFPFPWNVPNGAGRNSVPERSERWRRRLLATS